MSVDRERALQVAQNLTDAQKFDRALEELQKVIQADPSDTRVLLRVGDLQVRSKDYAAAITTYERVADFYSKKGFALKAVAVYKQVRELVQKHAADRASRYDYVVERLTTLYVDLGLLSEALSTLDEEANWLRSQDREQDAVVMYRRMTDLSQTNPLPHLRLAEGLCRVGEVDDAMMAFATAADLLVEGDRPDDALRVMERMLHFKQDPEIAKTAARIYLDKGTQPEGMQALSRLQICFQADPKDLETLELLALAFDVIGQGPKAFEVRKEIARIAHEQGDVKVFRATLELLQQQGPNDQQVQALTQLPPPKRSGGPSEHPANEVPAIPRAPANPTFDRERTEARPSQELETIEELEFLDDSGIELEELEPADEAPAASGELRITDSLPEVGVDSFDRTSFDDPFDRDSAGPYARSSSPGESSSSSVIPLRMKASSEPGPRTVRPPDAHPSGVPASSAPPASSRRGPDSQRSASRTTIEPGRPPSMPPSDRLDPQAHTKRALADAAAFRGLRLVDKAIETIQVALEFDPQSIELRESLRDLYVERGDRDAAIEEMLTMAAIYLEYDHSEHATTVLINVLEAVPDHPVATRTLSQIRRQSSASGPPSSRRSSAPVASAPAASAPATSAPRASTPRASTPPASAPPASVPSTQSAPVSSGPLPRFDASGDDEAGTLEDALEEAEFFAARGLFDDAMLILHDQLERANGHPLLLEAIRDVEAAMAEAASGGSAVASDAAPAPSTASPASNPQPKSAPEARANGAEVAPQSSKPQSSKPQSSKPRSSKPQSSKAGRDKAAPATKRSADVPVGEDFDIRAQLGELERAVRESQQPPPPGRRRKKNAVNVDKVFASFKARVRSKVSDHDSSTHYDLGVAYKEMKLFDDAIEELKMAAHDSAIECNSYSMIGLIYAEQARWEDASKALTRALGSAQKTPAQEANLYYDLGHAHEQLERTDKAAYYFQQVLRRDSNFRDVRERIANLRRKSQPPVSSPAPTTSPSAASTATSDDELDRAFEELLGD